MSESVRREEVATDVLFIEEMNREMDNVTLDPEFRLTLNDSLQKKEDLIEKIWEMALLGFAQRRSTLPLCDVIGANAITEMADSEMLKTTLENAITLMGQLREFVVYREFVTDDVMRRADLVVMDRGEKKIYIIVELKTIRLHYICRFAVQDWPFKSQSTDADVEFNDLRFHKERICMESQRDFLSSNPKPSYDVIKTWHIATMFKNAKKRTTKISTKVQEACEQLERYCKGTMAAEKEASKAKKVVCITFGPFVYTTYL